jgi:Na+-driven multidrug efflux pump
LSIARVQKNIRMLVVIQGCLCVLLLGFSSVLIDVMGLVGVGVACLLSYSIVAVGLLVTQPETFQWRLPVEHDR